MDRKTSKAIKARAILEYLRDTSPTPQNASQVWDAVVARYPLDEDERELTSRGRSRGHSNFTFSSLLLASVGWIDKLPDGSGWTITDSGRSALSETTDALALEERLQSARKIALEANAITLAERIVPFEGPQRVVVQAAALFVDEGLRAGGSVFVPSRSIWTRAAVDELLEHFVGAPNEGGSFLDQLERQLEPASDDAKLLMAELVAWQVLPIYPTALGEASKLAHVQRVLDTMKHPVEIPKSVALGYKGGSFNPGPAMMRNRPEAMTIIVRLVDAWLRAGYAAQEQLLQDALAWRDFVAAVPGQKFPTQRNALTYLVHPEFFGPLVSDDDKRAIANQFAGELATTSGDLDRDLRDITVAMQVKLGRPVNFYGPDLLTRWQSPVAPILPPEPEPGPIIRPSTSSLANLLHVPASAVDTWIDELDRKGQIVFYGPPGTGKTYIARHLAKHLAGDDQFIRTVQFHPSYSYEDFFQGFRPMQADGQVTFTLTDGPLLKLVHTAVANPDRQVFLIIDEMNRANLPKVFGELYFALTNRDQPIDLQYGEEGFRLPTNLRIIATMNTTDRSIALLDAAMRRRFSFIELHPDKSPVREMFATWVARNPVDIPVARLLADLNARIADSAFKVGPSYFMDPKLDQSRLERIWANEILPLLEELHYGEDGVAERFALDSLLRSATPIEIRADESEN